MKNKKLLIVFSIVLVNQLAFGVVIPLIPYIADVVGASTLQIGLLTAAYPVAQLLGAPLLGRLSDRMGRKPILIVSILGTALGFAVLGVATTLPLLFLSRLIDGITGGNINVAQAYIADVTAPKERGKAMGLIGAAFGLGFIVGPVTGGLLGEISYSLPAWLGLALSLVNVVLVMVFLPESLTAEAKARLTARATKLFNWRGFAEALGHPRVGPILSVRSVTGVSWTLFESVFSLWAIAVLAVGTRETGLLLGYVGVLSVFVQGFAMGKLTKRFSDDHLLLYALVSAGVALMAWGTVRSVWVLLLVMPFLSLGIGVGQTVMTSALSKAVHPDEVGGVLGIQTSVMSFARAISPVIGAFLLQSVGKWAPGVFAGVVTLLMLPYAYKTLCLVPGRDSCEADFAE